MNTIRNQNNNYNCKSPFVDNTNYERFRREITKTIHEYNEKLALDFNRVLHAV